MTILKLENVLIDPAFSHIIDTNDGWGYPLDGRAR